MGYKRGKQVENYIRKIEDNRTIDHIVRKS